MAVYTLSPNVKRQLLDNSGNPLAGGLLYTVSAGGSYPADAVTTYQTSSGTAHSNPITLDSAGRISGSSEIYLQPGTSVKFILHDSADALVWTQDNIAAVPSSSVNLDVTGIAGENLAAGDFVYLSTGALGGGATAGAWYKTDADSATTSTAAFQVGVVPDAIAVTATGTIRLAGQVTLAGPLSPGAAYYLSATAGAITATPPANAFRVGQAQSSTVLDLGYFKAPVSPQPPNGRLTLTTGVPVTVSDVTGAGTVYFTPYLGNQISLYNGTSWDRLSFTELSIAVPAPAGKLYDVFCYNANGVPTLELSAAWNASLGGASARFAAGTYAVNLPTQNGMRVKSTDGTAIDATRLYLGTFQTTAAGTATEDSFLNRLLWNNYNRVQTGLRSIETTNTWSYSTAAYRIANNASAAAILTIVTGVAEVYVSARVSGVASNSAPAPANYQYVNIGLNSLTPISGALIDFVAVVDASVFNLTASVEFAPTVPGVNSIYWLEYASSVGTTTWYGDNGAPTLLQSGICGSFER